MAAKALIPPKNEFKRCVYPGKHCNARAITLAWETLEKKRDYLKSIFIHKILNNLAAINLSHMFPISYNLRNSETDLVLSKPKTEFKNKSFSHNGAFFGITYVLRQKRQIQYLDFFKRLIRLKDLISL